MKLFIPPFSRVLLQFCEHFQISSRVSELPDCDGLEGHIATFFCWLNDLS